MTRFRLDLAFALRTLRRSPLFTAVAVLSLALGIGANTAIFSLLDQVLLRLLPVRDPQQLVMIWTTGPHLGNNRGSRAVSYPMYQEYQRQAKVFSHVFCRFLTPTAVSINNETERVTAELVSGNYFDALGVGAAVGRVFTAADDREYKGHPYVVLSHTYWVNRFQANPQVVGQKMVVNNYPMTIVGVSAPGFAGLDPTSAPQIRVPVQMKPVITAGWDDLGNRRSQWINVFARLQPGYTHETAKAALQPLLNSILRDDLQQKEMKDTTAYNRERFLKRQPQVERAETGYSQVRESGRVALLVLMAMVALVLLIACSNVANLLVARAVARQKEIAVRLSVGASRGQIVRQLLLESLLLSLAGGIVGIGLSVLVLRGLLASLPTDGAPLMLSSTPDWRILGFTLGLATLTGLLFGLLPALQATRPDLWSTLKDVVGSVSGGSGSSVTLRKALVTAQVALSFLLLAGAGLFMRTLHNLKATDTGFRELGHLVTFQVDPSLNGYDVPRQQDFYERLLAKVKAMPGVQSAGMNVVPVLAGNEWDSSMSVEGHKANDGEDMQAFMNAVTPGYFPTLGVPLVEGRDFDRRDAGKAAKVAIVNRKFAEHFFKNGSAIGRHVGFGTGPDTKLDIEIVGVVENHLYEGPREGVRRQVFLPNTQFPFPAGMTLYARTSLEPAAILPQLRRQVRELDAALPVYEMKTLAQQLDETLVAERLVAWLSTAFGALATALAALGLYGVMAFVVARRAKEIGLRMALGAQRGTVRWLVLREVLVLLGIGLLVGVPAAYALSRQLGAQLFGVPAADWATGLGATVLLASVALLAGFVPARKASNIDPIVALRYE